MDLIVVWILQLYLAADTVTQFFNPFAVISRTNEFEESFDRRFRVFCRVDMFKPKDVILTAVGVFQGRGNAVNSYGGDRIILYKIRQGHISNGTFILGNTLEQESGVIRLKGLIGNFFHSAQCILRKEGTRTGSLRTGNQDNRFVRTADFFPILDFRRKDLF